jgi:enoyl-CoA hydratase/carnithine racemase
MHRPDRRNALNATMIQEILDALDQFETDDAVRVVVVRGGGDAFCAGVDLAELRAVRETTGTFEFGRLPDLFGRLRDYPKPTVAVVHGAAIAGGCELALHCDIRLGSAAARFAMPLAKLGLVIPAYAAERLVQTVGLSAAREMLITGEAVDGVHAAHIGLLARVYDADQLEAAVEKTVASIAQNAPLSLRAMKRIINQLAARLDADARAALDAERHDVSRSEDLREGLNAFFERRAPVFRGC